MSPCVQSQKALILTLSHAPLQSGEAPYHWLIECVLLFSATNLPARDLFQIMMFEVPAFTEEHSGALVASILLLPSPRCVHWGEGIGREPYVSRM